MPQDTVRKYVMRWIDQSNLTQNELAKRLGISAPALSTMLSGKIALPMERFLQIANILHPDQADVDTVFSAYLEELQIPHSSMRLLISVSSAAVSDKEDLRARLHALIDQIPEDKLIVLEPIMQMMIQTQRTEDGEK